MNSKKRLRPLSLSSQKRRFGSDSHNTALSLNGSTSSPPNSLLHLGSEKVSCKPDFVISLGCGVGGWVGVKQFSQLLTVKSGTRDHLQFLRQRSSFRCSTSKGPIKLTRPLYNRFTDIMRQFKMTSQAVYQTSQQENNHIEGQGRRVCSRLMKSKK